VLGTLVIQGLTLKPLMRMLDLRDEDPVGQELATARERALHAALAALDGDRSASAEAVRREFKAHLRASHGRGDRPPSPHAEMHSRALTAAREAILAMRASEEIGDDAFHRIEEELDWMEMAGGRR
jgi:CPA1 family monovalent cation:H+ antiporter